MAQQQEEQYMPSPSAKATTTSTTGAKALSGIANIVKLLPAGTVCVFQFLDPVLSNNGRCDTVHRVLTTALVALCGLSCCFSCFTDSYTGVDGRLYYGIVTTVGLLPLWDPNPRGLVDLTRYRLRPGDFVRAAYSLAVFAVISLLDPNTISCFYPSFVSEGKVLLILLPPMVGGMASFVNLACPNTRHGIGYAGAPASGVSWELPLTSLKAVKEFVE